MAEALSRLVPNSDSRLILLIRHAQVSRESAFKVFVPSSFEGLERLAELRIQYARLSTPSLQQAYSEALEWCRLDPRGRNPKVGTHSGAGASVEGATEGEMTEWVVCQRRATNPRL